MDQGSADQDCVDEVMSEEQQVVTCPSSEEFRASAWVSCREQYDKIYRRSVEDPNGFWGGEASKYFWETKWKSSNGNVHSGNFDLRKGPISVEWFKGGKTNICYNALDKHVKAGKGDDIAIYWEGNEPWQHKRLSYKELLGMVCQLANFLRSVGVKKGDSVAIYLPMLPELPTAMLACARIGAIHTVVFGGFSADALGQQLIASKAKVLITTSRVWRGRKVIKLKEIVEEALSRALAEEGFTIETCLTIENDSTVKRRDTPLTKKKDVSWQDLMSSYSTECDVEWVHAEDPLFLLYTSGNTGTPKGIVHTVGGCMVYTAATFKYMFDYHAGEVYWCTTDCGWITGHSYLIYGPFLNRAAVVLFEGIPTYPYASRYWEVIDKYSVNIFYTTPTTIQALMCFGDEFMKAYSQKSLRLLGSIGEPINNNAWRWFYEAVGNQHCPIIDIRWQMKLGGFESTTIEDKKSELSRESNGALYLKALWPGTCTTILGDNSQYVMQDLTPFKSYKFSR
ncbi:hypothetical protein O6H91_03G048800 [Diphasiastrum complanatum]|uniref:Uncharacterized protein n=1 Tax=Diphasiastrum complanatum TaxID=34168 RepID=A0ACC2E6M9_DIPCM|nr:hypothetical protein O6H91_03G048800 [Diphasiastrum complanatum]